MPVRGRAVFITGAGSGLGAALARHYAERGATLGLLGRKRGPLEALAFTLPSRALVYSADVRDAGALRVAARDFMASAGVPRIVIACAGISVGADSALAEDLPVFRAVMEVNLLGMVHTLHPFIEPMRKARAGILAGISSIAGVRGLPGGGAYSASKAAATNYLESLRVELCGSGVRVVTIAPGYVVTPMTAVNPYRMPFILSADTAARHIGRAIERGRRYAVVPWQMRVVSAILGALPNWAYDRAFRNAPRKPRNLPL